VVSRAGEKEFDIYTELYYDISRVISNLKMEYGGEIYLASGYIFGGAVRDHQAGLLPHDIDITLNFVPNIALREQLLNVLARQLTSRVGDIVRATPLISQLVGGYTKYGLEIFHRRLGRQINVDVVFDLQPILDFDINGLIFQARAGTGNRLCVAQNPMFRNLPIKWDGLPRLLARRQFHIVHPSFRSGGYVDRTLRERLRKMQEYGWTCLNLPTWWR